MIDNGLGFDQPFDRRTLLGKAAVAGGVLAAGGLLTAGRASAGSAAAAGKVTIWFGQFGAIAEQEGIRKYVFKGFNGDVDAVFAPITAPTLFVDRVRAEAKAGRNDIDVLVGLHGDFAFQNEGLIRGVGDVAAQIKTLPPPLVKHGKLGTKTQYYVPHSQATYVMVANKDVMRYLPKGADINALTYGQLFQWAKAIRRGTGQNRFGLPASETGLMHGSSRASSSRRSPAASSPRTARRRPWRRGSTCASSGSTRTRSPCRTRSCRIRQPGGAARLGSRRG